jgi:nucleoside permease NupC
VTEQEGVQESTQPEPTTKSGVSTKIVIAFVVMAVFAGVIAAKYLSPSRTGGGEGQASQTSVTSVRNDAAADYEAAVKTGKPIYVLFHSLS